MTYNEAIPALRKVLLHNAAALNERGQNKTLRTYGASAFSRGLRCF
jgi:hypothetical protein